MDLFLTLRNSLSVSAGMFSKKKIEQGFPCILLVFIFFLPNKGYGAISMWKSLIPGDDWPVSPLSSCSPGSPDSPLSVVVAGLACSLLTARHERELRPVLFYLYCVLPGRGEGRGGRYISYFSPHTSHLIQILSSLFCCANCQTNLQPASSVGPYRNSVTWLIISQITPCEGTPPGQTKVNRFPFI